MITGSGSVITDVIWLKRLAIPVMHNDRNPVALTGWVLLLTQALWLLLLFSFRWNPITYGTDTDYQTIFPAGMFDRILLTTSTLFAFISAIGAVSMIRGTSFRRSVIGSIAACVPILGPFCIAGVPIGTCALLLLKREKTQRFFANKRIDEGE